LSKLQHEAFLQSEIKGECDDSSKEAWRQAVIAKRPTLKFWDTDLRLEILGLAFVQARR